jgi:AraC-like DNA-binding protein
MKSEPSSFYRYFPVSGRDRKWGLFATTAGESRIPPGATYPPAGHPKGYAFDWQHGRVLDEYALVYISSGRGKFECRAKSSPAITAPIEAGYAFMVFPGVWHRYTPHPETGWHEHWVGFDGETARHWQKNKFFRPSQPAQKINAEETMLFSYNAMIQAIKTNRPALQQIMAGVATHLLGLFFSAQQAQAEPESHNPNAIESAITRIQRDLAQELDMKALAQELGVGYSWFRGTFARHTGLSPYQYLLETRMLRARSLLAETDLSVKEIAQQTGFEDQHYFSRLFRQRLNLTPSAWRNRSRKRIPR